MREKIQLLLTLFFVNLSAQDSLLLSGIPKWDQTWPYNMYCPIDSSLENLIDGRLNGHFPVGCVAVAVAQIMRYYSYPARGQGSIQYTTKSGLQLGMKFDTCTFDWGHMPLKVTAESPQIEQQSVAKLLSAVGLMYKTNYKTSGSGAEGGLFANYVSSMVDFSGNVRWNEKSSFLGGGWDSLMQRELQSGRPVLYSASSGKMDHIFVIEGYKKRNGSSYYFINSGNGTSGTWCHGDSIFYNTEVFNVDETIFSPIAPASLPTPGNLKYSINDTGLFVTWEPVQDARLCYYQLQIWNADETQRGIKKADALETRKKIVGYTDTAEVKKFFPEDNERITISIVAINKDSTGSCLAPWLTITRNEFILKSGAASRNEHRSVAELIVRRYGNIIELTFPEQAGAPREAALFTLNGACIVKADKFMTTPWYCRFMFREKGLAPSALILRIRMADGRTINRMISGIVY